jgi:hypothetical protein
MEPSTASGRSGILIARAWQEPEVPDGVRIRVVWTAGPMASLSTATPHSAVVDTPEALLELVVRWFSLVAEAPRGW